MSTDQLKMLDWICVYLLERSSKRVKELQSSNLTAFDTRNNSQVFYAINLAVAYGHRAIFNAFYQSVKSAKESPEKAVLTNLLSLYGANLIIKNYLSTMYEGGYLKDINGGELLQNGILELLPLLKNEAISLIDAIAPPDFIVDSPLGMSDGRVYDHLKSIIYQTPETFERVEWWQDITHRDYIKPKL